MSLHAKRGKSPSWLVIATVFVTGSYIAACATGSKSAELWNPDEGNDTEVPDAGTDGSGGDGGDLLGFGEPCTVPAQCASKQCTPIGTGASSQRVCTEACTEGQACPNGAYCAFVAGRGYQCVPDNDTICGACTSDASCKGAGEKCVESAFGDAYCARDCSFDGVCPANYKCVDFDEVEEPDADAGADDDDAGTDAPDAGGDDPGASSGSKKGNKYCVPVDKSGEPQSCECSPKRAGATRSCERTSVHGTCTGTQTCDGTGWSSCSAPTPELEVCDGIDNDCDGEPDNAPIEQLCPVVPQGTQVCETGQCKLTGCEEGWTNSPPGPVSEGCQCRVIDGPESNTCATAIAVGTAVDLGSGVEIIGTLPGFGVEKWYRFETTDRLAATGTISSYHVSIRIEEPSPNNEFLFEVIRGASCAGQKFSGLTAYDWCSDFTGTRDGQKVGHGDCSPRPPSSPAPAANHCSRGAAAPYYVRVYRNPDLPTDANTCRTFKLSVQASGSRGDFDCNATSVCSATP